MKLIWTRLALHDLNNAYEYIAASRPDAARDMIERIEKALDALLVHPHIGRPGRIEGTRELAIAGTPFIAPYRVKNDSAIILALIHGARRWPEEF